MPARVSLKDLVIGTFWGNTFYRRVLQPFDRWHVEPQPAATFETADLALNKVCRLSDSANPLWRQGFADLGFPDAPARFHRKVWEFNQTLYGLRKLGRLTPGSVALGIGCGHEELMYFLANRIARVVATDLYEGSYLGGESDADVLEHPAKYAPFNFREDHLEVRRMNGLALDAADGSFDFAFCLSSIEHFGTVRDKRQAFREMFRVLKPGGVAVVTTEVVLNRLGRGAQYFPLRTLLSLVADAGFTLDRAPDLRVEREHAAPPLALPMDTFTTPHVVLRNFHTIYTSVALFLMKPPGAPSANALTGDEHAIHLDPYRYSAAVTPLDRPSRVIAGEPYSLALGLRNTGNTTWFADPSRSHMVRVGAWFSDADGRNLTGEPIRAPLPHHVRPGEECEVVIRLTAPERSAAGIRLHVGLVKELCFWFRDQGGTDEVFPLEFA